MINNSARFIYRAFKAALPWLLLFGMIAWTAAADFHASYLAVASACLAVVMLLLCGFAIKSTDRTRRLHREFEETCSQWTCPYCGQVYGPTSSFQAYATCEDSHERWANVVCTHCDRLNTFAKDWTRLHGSEEPMSEIRRQIRAGLEQDAERG